MHNPNEKVASAIVVSALSGVLVYFDYARQRAAGREAFMAAQATRFDNYIAHPHLVSGVIGVVIILLFALFLYEGIAYLFSKIANRTSED